MNIAKPSFYSILPLFILCDLFVSPLFDIGIISLRLSFIVIIFIAIKVYIHKILKANKFTVHPTSFSFLAITLIIVSTFGHYTGSISNELHYNFESAKSIIYILFMIAAFTAGRNTVNFKVHILKYLFYLVVLTNVLFTIGIYYIPDRVFNFYFPAKILTSEFAVINGIDSIEAIRSWYRPLGPHGSPTYSAFAVNIAYLFFTLAIIKKYIVTNSLYERLIILISPVLLALFYSSRTEFVFSVTISIVLYNYWFLKGSGVLNRLFYISFTFLSLAGVYAILIASLGIRANEISVVDIDRFAALIKNPLTGGDDKVRATFMFNHAWDRFITSPLFGTGFGLAKYDSYNPVWFYHNDLFYILVTSGLLGLFIYLYLIAKYIIPVHIVLTLPFIITGQTNSFLLVLPMVVAYFYMIGIFYQLENKKNRKVHIVSREISSPKRECA